MDRDNLPLHQSAPLHIWALTLLVVFGLMALSACDQQAAEATAESIQAATEKKEALAWMPINWTATVTQCDTKDGCRTRFYSPSKQGTEQARLAPTRTKDQSDPAKFGERK